MSTDLPEKPESRKESYLADIAGQEVVLPEEPKSREEQYLAYIAEHGGGGGSGVRVLTDAEYNALWSSPNSLTAILTNIATGAGV